MSVLLCGVAWAEAQQEASGETSDVRAVPNGGDRAEEGNADQVPLRRVVLFSSGVGFFEHAGTVDGDATIELRFRVDDINDLLKSMVLQDFGGGQISTVSYGSRDPITRALQTFAIDLTENPTLPDLLKQIRGEQIEIEAPNKITGTIVSVEKRTKKISDSETVEYHVLNLLTAEGLRSISLENVNRIRLLNERLNNELQQALLILATGLSTDKKTVSLNFRGEGERPVRIGYIQETPVWKTSYRLVLQDDDDPHLQGWAIVENTTEADWSNVALSLVSGRPISFQMDLYQPLYVDRPWVVPELYASLVPKVHDQDLALREKAFEEAAKRAEAPRAAALRQQADGLARSGRAREMQNRRGVEAESRLAVPGAPPTDKADMISGIPSSAEAADVGELFQYSIEAPVSLDRQRSAMLPIINEPVEGEKLSLFNPATHAKHPLNALRLTNTSDLHLMQGPLTVFDEGTYAGDARVPDLPPRSARLISYAMDLDTEVARESKSHPEHLVSARIDKGVLQSSRKYRRAQTYTVRNSGRRTKQVLIEQPVDADWKLIEPEEADEKTRDLYRFRVEAEPGVPETLTVVEERTVSQAVHLTNINDPTIRIFLSAEVVSERVREALREVIRRKQEISELIAARSRLEAEVQQIAVEQERIRKNMEQLDRTTDLYGRYVKKFGEQEDQIEKSRKEIDRLRKEEAERQQALDKFLLDLTIE